MRSSSYVSSRAEVVGEVFIEENVIIAPGASIRADEGSPFRIRKGTNIQDDVVLHGLLGQFVEVNGEKYSIFIDSHCSIAHKALIHGPTAIGKKTFVGFRATVHKSSVGAHCFLGINAVVCDAKIGDRCHIGIGAIVKGVTIATGRFVADGSHIASQHEADILPAVWDSLREEDDRFNQEVVDYNKQLAARYRERRIRRNSK